MEVREHTKNKQGKVWLVGAGPGDVGLLTLKGMEVLQEAEVVVYDALVSLELLALIPKKAERINVGKRAGCHLASQTEINEILRQKAAEGKQVVRLKGGDPFVFGRGGEELELLCREQIPYEVVPGITSAIAVPAYNGIPVTHRDYTSSFHVITGHRKKNNTLDINFEALVKMGGTLVFLMGVSTVEEICYGLLQAGMDKHMPAAMLEQGTTSNQKRVVATVSTLTEQVKEMGLKSPAVLIVGRVCQLEQQFAWAEKRPLFGKQILVTRPKEKASILAKKLRRLGAQVIEFPTIATIPIEETPYKEAVEALEQGISGLLQEQGNTCVVFTSPQGVTCFFQQLKERKIDMRRLLANPKLTYGVIGTATKAALEQYNIFADYMPNEYSGKALGELLAKELSKETKVYLFRALEGTATLTDILNKEGISYQDIPIYKTVYEEENDFIEKVEQAFSKEEISYVTFTSASTVRGFVHRLQNVDATKIHAVCIGKETAREAEKYGMDISISKEAAMDSMVELLLSKSKVTEK